MLTFPRTQTSPINDQNKAFRLQVKPFLGVVIAVERWLLVWKHRGQTVLAGSNDGGWDLESWGKQCLLLLLAHIGCICVSGDLV
jgi:hypothetical protein